jgi:uncharacterized membrane-anchored protein
LGIPYGGTTALWAVVLAGIFWQWHRSEGTLSIHSITTRRREWYYWATVFATFALGTALGDFTATSLNLGYLPSGLLFGLVILIPAVAWRVGLNPIAAFWFAYVVTRPLGASFADYMSKPHAITGMNFGDGPTSAVSAAVLLLLVAYIAIRRSDIQAPSLPGSSASATESADAQETERCQQCGEGGVEGGFGPLQRPVVVGRLVDDVDVEVLGCQAASERAEA